jgi:hypothetical protein
MRWAIGAAVIEVFGRFYAGCMVNFFGDEGAVEIGTGLCLTGNAVRKADH